MDLNVQIWAAQFYCFKDTVTIVSYIWLLLLLLPNYTIP